MPKRLYTDHPELYDVSQSDWDYQCVCTTRDRLSSPLEIGCGTGEHTRRLVAEGFNVRRVLTNMRGMLSVVREKCDANFRQSVLPDLDINNKYEAVMAIRGVVNHLSPK